MHFLPPDVDIRLASPPRPPRINAWTLALGLDDRVARALLRKERVHLTEDAAELSTEDVLWWCALLRRADQDLYRVVLAERGRRVALRAWVPTTKLVGDGPAPWQAGTRVMVLASHPSREVVLVAGMEGRIVGTAIPPRPGEKHPLPAVAELGSHLAKLAVGTSDAYLVEFPPQRA